MPAKIKLHSIADYHEVVHLSSIVHVVHTRLRSIGHYTYPPPDGFSNRTQLLAAAKNVSAEAFTRTTNASLGARLITCDERAFGHLDLISCMNAASQISLDLHLREFRERYTVRMGNIPQRWISSELIQRFDRIWQVC